MPGCLEGQNGPFTEENWKALQKIVTEFLATAIFVYCGLASCINWTHDSDPDQLIRIAIAFGFGLTALAYIYGPISGCHVNPAVTIACVATGRTKLVMGMLYIGAQCVGAIVGAAILYFIQAEDFSGEHSSLFGLTKINPNLTVHQGLFIEAAGAGILVLVVLCVTDKSWADYNLFAAVAIGITLVVIELGFVNSTGGSFNPARTLGPAVIVADYGQVWAYWLGPIVGALVAVGIYKLITYEVKAKDTIEEEIPAEVGDSIVTTIPNESIITIIEDQPEPKPIHTATTSQD